MRICDALRIGRGDVVTLTGGGGKTTVMFRLAAELVAAGLTVVSTMTTKIFVGQMAAAPHSFLLADEPDPVRALAGALPQHRHVLVGGRIGAEREKLEGVPPEVVDGIAASRIADVILVEADGSRGRPFKAPAAHEPVVPASTTILAPLFGLDAAGRPLNEEHVHRPQIVAELAGVPIGQPVTPEVVARVLSHPEGGAKGLLPEGRLVPLLNKADLQESVAREIATLLLIAAGVDEVVVAAAASQHPVQEVFGRVAAVVLAAGQAKRFGSLKQVLSWEGQPLVAHVAQQALACTDVSGVIVTTGAEAAQVEAALGPLQGDERFAQVHVPDWAAGQSRSVRAGLMAAQQRRRRPLSAALFLLADQPGVTPELLTALIQRHRETLAPIVAPRYEGKRGNPVLFDRSVFDEFDALDGDEGARSIIRQHEAEVAWVDWPSEAILKDIDTPEDYG